MQRPSVDGRFFIIRCNSPPVPHRGLFEQNNAKTAAFGVLCPECGCCRYIFRYFVFPRYASLTCSFASSVSPSPSMIMEPVSIT